MACLFGHKWNDCKCSKCGKVRDEQHDWDMCKGKCKICGKVRTEQHDWDGCKCSKCGQGRNEQHDWDGCKCSKCGQSRNEKHDWDGCKCNKCGQEQHDWDLCKGKCVKCGKICNEQHDWDGHQCKRCGKEQIKNIRFIACICQDQPNINSLKPTLQRHIIDMETRDGSNITPQTIIAFDSTRMGSLLFDKNYMNQMLRNMLSKAPAGYNIYGYDIYDAANKLDYDKECKAKFFVLYEK